MLIGLMQAAQKKVNTVIEVGIVTKDLEDRGYHEELPKVYRDRREETPTVYYVNDECPYCLAEVVWRDAIREDGVIQYSWLATSFFILDRECASIVTRARLDGMSYGKSMKRILGRVK